MKLFRPKCLTTTLAILFCFFTFNCYAQPVVPLPSSGTLYLVGDATQGGWANPVPVPSQQFAQLDSVTYGGVFNLIGGKSYLILPANGSWETKYAIPDTNAVGVTTSGSFKYYTSGGGFNFIAPSLAGTYTIKLDFEKGTYSLNPFVGTFPDSLYIVGDATAGGWNNPVPVPSQQFTQENSGIFELTLPLKADASYLFLPVNGDWSHKLGGASPTGGTLYTDNAMPSSNTPSPLVASTYKIVVNFVTSQYSVTSVDSTTYSFSPDTAYSGTTVTIKGSGFTGATAVSFGGIAANSFFVVNDSTIKAVVDSNGYTGNISIATKKGVVNLGGFVFLVKGGITPPTTGTLFIVGTSVPGGWANPLVDTISQKFIKVTPFDYKLTTPLIGGGQYKFIAKSGSWGENWGAKGYYDSSEIDGGEVVAVGENILGPVQSGTYLIDVNFATSMFTVTPVAPYILSVSSNTAYKGDTIIVKGVHFTGTLKVRFGVDSAASFFVLNDSTIKAIVGIGASGSVSVTTGSGTGTIAGFSYCKPSLDTISITACGSYKWHGTTYTKSGNYTFDSLNTAGCDSLTTLVLKVGYAVTDTITLSIPNSYTWHGTTYTKSGTYTFDTLGVLGCDSLTVLNLTIYNSNTPSITSFTPPSACSNQSTTLFIIGSYFTGATSVTVGGIAVDSFRANSSTSITAYVRAGVTGTVKVETSNGTATSAISFTNSTGYTAYAYVSNVESNNVSVINIEIDSVIATVAAVDKPSQVTVSKDGTRVYVANSLGGTVTAINTADNSSSDLPLRLITGMAVSPDGSRLYAVCAECDTLTVFNTVSNSVASKLYIHGVQQICLSPDGKKAYTLNNNSVTFINTETNSITATVQVGNVPASIAITPDGQKLYFTNTFVNYTNVNVISTITDTVIATIPVGKEPRGICISPDGTKVYVSNYLDHTISIINSATDKVVQTFPIGFETGPEGLNVSPDGRKLYVACATDSVIVVNTSTNTVQKSIGVGYGPAAYGNFIANVPTSCTLPVDIANISASIKNSSIAVNWFTATELNTSHFIVQHSTNGNTFTDLGSVKAIGIGANKYEYTDVSPVGGTNYYRLKSVDKDGAVTYSKVVSVQLTIDNYKLTVVPNPVREVVTVKGNHIASVQVIDNLGRVVKTVSLKDATNPVLVVGGLQAGAYHLRVRTTDGKVSAMSMMKE